MSSLHCSFVDLTANSEQVKVKLYLTRKTALNLCGIYIRVLMSYMDL